MNDIVERLSLLIETEKITMTWLERQTGIKRKRWYAIKERKVMRTSELEAVQKIYPEYKVWLSSGMEFPEHGQISPETKEIPK